MSPLLRRSSSLLLLILLTLLPAIFVNCLVSSVVDPLVRAELLRQAFLAQFGMKSVPEQSIERLPPPSYIYDLYDRVQEDAEVDSVRHYYPVWISSNDHNHDHDHGHDHDHDHDLNDLRLHYDLSLSTGSMHPDERIRRGELKLKLNCSSTTPRRIDVFEVDQQYEQVRRLIDTRFISDCESPHRWVDFDVTEALTRRRPDLEQVDFAIALSDSSWSSTTSRTSAALVLFVDNSISSTLKRTKRASRQRQGQQGQHQHQHRHRHHQHQNHHRTGLEHRQLCQRRELYVDFAELNWLDWILAPYGYHAYQCAGDCVNPLASHFNVTNHAIVQSLLNSVNPGAVPPPCCVPTEMRPLSILYIDIDNRIVIKTYPDMVVDSCGCR